MPVKTAMKTAIGMESTPSRRMCPMTSGRQTETSASARVAPRVQRPTCEMISIRPGARRASRRRTGKSYR